MPEALQLYQRARVERCARVVTESREMAGLYHIADAEDDPLTAPLQ